MFLVLVCGQFLHVLAMLAFGVALVNNLPVAVLDRVTGVQPGGKRLCEAPCSLLTYWAC